MRNINNETRVTMSKRRNFVNYANMTLSDGTVLHLTPSDFRIAGQSFTDDWNDGETFSIGTAIGKTATLLLDNTDGRIETVGSSEVVYPNGKFSEYDFYMAKFQLFVCLPDAYTYGSSLRDEMILIGTFTVTTPTSHGATIEITGVDNMYKLDKPFDDVGLVFTSGQTLLAIANAICEYCGVILATQEFENDDLVITNAPENATCRQVISWIAQIAGCNAVMTETGSLKFKWYDMSALNSIDDGTFTAIGEEKVFMRSYVWDGAGGAYKQTGWDIYYSRIPRTGRYKITKVVIEDIADPNNFNAFFSAYQYDCYDGSGTNRYNAIEIEHRSIHAGENILNFEFDITKTNYVPYWVGVGEENYVSPNASSFKATFYIEAVSYDDGDSYEGGTFDVERKYLNTTHWNYDGSSTTVTGWWFWVKYFLNSILKPAGTYKVTKIIVSNIADPSHFNAYWRIRKSTDSGATWTELKREPLVAGENIVDFDVEVVAGDEVRYQVGCGQEISVDPNASEFDFDVYFRADSIPYLDGDDIDGGNFTSPLDYHNLTALKGTSISTDDIKFTGVLVVNGDTSAHYPESNWDNYAMQISDNPFVAGHEGEIAEYIYSRLSGLKFRPFSTSTIQDPTIEAGDPCVIYDVKGNMYNSIITNVKFKTGGMTELSCTAEPPAQQGSSYVSTAVYKAEKKQTDFNTRQAYFNDIANSALGYYTTEVVDPSTGATITYKHDQPTLEASQYVIKIAGTLIAISDDGGATYNSGLDTTTATLLMNLVYAHGIVADWMRSGSLLLTGEVDGMTFTAYNYFYFLYEQSISNTTVDRTLYKFDNEYSPVIDVQSISGNVTASIMTLTAGPIYTTLETITLQLGENKFTTVIPKQPDHTMYLVRFNATSGSCTVSLKGYHYAVDIRPNIHDLYGRFCDMYVYDLAVGDIVVESNLRGGGVTCDTFTCKDSLYLLDGSHYTYIWKNNGTFLATTNDGTPKYVQWSGGSDRRLKENIQEVDTDYIEQFFNIIEPVKFNYKTERENDYIGLIAQDLRDALKYLGLKNDKIVIELPDVGDNGGMLAIDYSLLIGHLIAGVKDLYNKVDQQQKEIDELKAAIEELKKK